MQPHYVSGMTGEGISNVASEFYILSYLGGSLSRVRQRRLLRLRRLDCLRVVLRRVQIAVDSKSLGFIMYS